MDDTKTTPAGAAAVRHALDLLGHGRAAEAEGELAALADAPWESDPEATRLRAQVLDGLGRTCGYPGGKRAGCNRR